MRGAARQSGATATTRDPSPEAAFGAVVGAMTRRHGVTYGGRGFGSSALKVDGRIFAMLSSKGQFVVKLPAPRARELVESGAATPFEPRPGKMMKEWVVAPAGLATTWRALAEEAQRFVAAGPAR